MKFLCRVKIGWKGAYEVQVFETDRLWLRLTRDPQRNSLGFWSAAGGSDRDWRSIAEALEGRLADVPADDRPAIDNAATYFPPGWDFWGPQVPAPIQVEVLSGEIEKAAKGTPISEIERE